MPTMASIYFFGGRGIEIGAIYPRPLYVKRNPNPRETLSE